MGRGMASNFLKAGHEVVVWNRSPDKTTTLQQLGAKLADSPKLATEQADIIFEVTANDESSQAVWQDNDGILAGADKTKTLIASATLSVDWTIQLSDLCSSAGFTFFDMPLTGGRVASESGILTLLVGGDKRLLELVKPDLSAISAKIFYFGPAGSGMKYKLVLNSLQAAHLVAFGEAMKLAVGQGLSAADVGSALCDRPGGAVTELAWKAYQQPTAPITFSIDWITKDLEYARQLADKSDLPILDDVLAIYKQSRNAGNGDQDWASILKT